MARTGADGLSMDQVGVIVQRLGADLAEASAGHPADGWRAFGGSFETTGQEWAYQQGREDAIRQILGYLKTVYPEEMSAG